MDKPAFGLIILGYNAGSRVSGSTPLAPRLTEGVRMRIQCTCAHCGKVTSRFLSQRTRHCSRECYRAHRVARSDIRFWEKVDRSGGPESCWIWTARRFDFGHGQFRTSQGNVPAHRFSWELAYGPIPDGLCVCHNCPGGDNPACVNPAHLFLGTYLDNNRDMHAKGRARVSHGSAHCQAKLTEADVLVIREALARGEPQKSLAERFGVSRSNVGLIGQRKIWAHVGAAEDETP